MTKERFEVMDYFDSENKPIKAIRDNETTEIYSMDNELEANSTCEKMNILYEEIQQSKVLIKKYYNENTDLIKENEQLKKDNKRLRNCINEIFTIARLEEL